MAVHTSSITTESNGHLTIAPNGTGKTKVNSVTADNPGVTIVAIDSNKVLQKFSILDLPTKASIDDADLAIIHDTSTNTIKNVLSSNI